MDGRQLDDRAVFLNKGDFLDLCYYTMHHLNYG